MGRATAYCVICLLMLAATARAATLTSPGGSAQAVSARVEQARASSDKTAHRRGWAARHRRPRLRRDGAPRLRGAAVKGRILSTSKGSWTGSPTRYRYTWEDCNRAGKDCTKIGSGTANSHKLTKRDVGHTIRAKVTATNSGRSASASSAATAVVAASAPPPSKSAPPPSNTALPVVSDPSPGSGGGSSEPAGIPGNWSLVFDSEFTGTSLPAGWADTRSGTNDVSTPASNVSVSGGNLNLTLSDSGTGAAVTTEPFTSPAPSHGGFELVPGEVAEARILIPSNGSTSAGNCVGWGAFWTNGDNWPTTGESDIVEEVNSDATTNYHQNAPGIPDFSSGPIPPAGSWCGSWHTFAIDRESTVTTPGSSGTNYIYWGGNLVETIPSYDNGAPQGLILNLGNGNGNAAPSSYPVTMKVQYVRVWKKTSG